MMVHMTALQ